MDDTQIIELYFGRSESAIWETAKKYGTYLNQISYLILRCREDTEEIVEDTYLAAWNTIPPIRPLVLRHFLSRITRNLSFNRLDYLTAKQRNRHMAVLLSELEDCVEDTGQNPEEQYQTRGNRKGNQSISEKSFHGGMPDLPVPLLLQHDHPGDCGKIWSETADC